jgi:hypothetical protein
MVQQQGPCRLTSTLFLPNLPSSSLLAISAALPRSESAFDRGMEGRAAAGARIRRRARMEAQL